MTRVGMVGLGVMGSGIAANLVAKGFELAVYARREAAAEALVGRGARRVASLAELGAASEVLILSVSDTAAVEQVLFGQGGAGEGLAPGSIVIDTSTISAEATRAFCARLAGRAVDLLDAPVSGGQKGAAEGTLTCMVGGSAEAFGRCAPVFAAFARTVTRIGESGAGQVCKACNQICVIASMLAASEMVALCLKTGIDPLAVRTALLGGSARSAVLENHTLRLIQRAFAPGFTAELLLKDLRLALELERAQGVFAPMTEAAEPLFARMVAEGQGGLDWSAIGALVQARSGLMEARP